ncbi:putative Vacuolar membrane-associated protein IML1 [Glarea lozoyensis 74030]|uniref:Putative Vacuolar membrane-associated protein IML1 n=1 Tax=Glarea lozoyensis (strain ATCC 74030 / MF5533) TaxID=1104152 RepID=H0EPB3_GLAL7|nr:putative Vacuolar membrane-associated protein IML1 [Glarea lozoyensis 74030]
MKKFNFVLDVEAARNFPLNVDVTYSWGRPDYKYTQYIHRSGILLVQITDEGSFLLLANRLYNNRTAAARESDRFPHHTNMYMHNPLKLFIPLFL